MHLMNIVPQLKSEAECQIWGGGEINTAWYCVILYGYRDTKYQYFIK